MDAKTASRYHEVYARSQRDPEGFWAEAAQEIDWNEPAKKVFDPTMGVYGRWFAGGVLQHLLQRDRPPCGARARRRRPRSSTIRRSPTPSDLHLCGDAARGADARRDAAGFRRQQGRPRHPLHADGAGGGVRDVGLRAHRRDAFGGVRRLRGEGTGDPHRRRQAEADPVGLLRHRAGPRRPIQAAARCRDRAGGGQAAACLDPAAPAGAGARSSTGRDHDWARPARSGDRGEEESPTACRCSRPIRSTSSTRRARPASRKAWCATMAATWSR